MPKVSEREISDQAIKFVKSNKKLLVEKFADLKTYPPSSNPTSIFMAGSPGAGKTEFSQSFIKTINNHDPKTRIVRIDADEIRKIIPQFNRRNSAVVQPAASIGVEKLFDHVQKYNQNVVVDGTFAHYEVSRRNVERIVNKKRRVGIFYIFQDPATAWEFTVKREAVEKRNIPKKAFIDAFISAKNNVNKIKKEFGKSITLFLIIKNFKNELAKFNIDIENVDSYLKFNCTSEKLNQILK